MVILLLLDAESVTSSAPKYDSLGDDYSLAYTKLKRQVRWQRCGDFEVTEPSVA